MFFRKRRAPAKIPSTNIRFTKLPNNNGLVTRNFIRTFPEYEFFNRNAFKNGSGNWMATYRKAETKGYMRRGEALKSMVDAIESDCWKITVTINGKNYVLYDTYRYPNANNLRNDPFGTSSYMRPIVDRLGVGDKITLTMFHNKGLVITYKRVPVRGFAFFEITEKWNQ
jgi:hypothetical protein